ncbi:MAG TPA: hypothetical protein VF439_00710 [Candidatus Paceibacterota bacterium]
MDIRREFYDDIDSEMDEYRRWELFSLGKLAFFLSDIVAWFQDLPRPVRWFLKAVFWAAVAAAVIWLFVLFVLFLHDLIGWIWDFADTVARMILAHLKHPDPMGS